MLELFSSSMEVTSSAFISSSGMRRQLKVVCIFSTENSPARVMLCLLGMVSSCVITL